MNSFIKLVRISCGKKYKVDEFDNKMSERVNFSPTGTRLRHVLAAGEMERRRKNRRTRIGQLLPIQPGALAPKPAPYVPAPQFLPRRGSNRLAIDPYGRPTRPLRPGESVTREMRKMDDDEPPPLQESPDDPSEGGQTCKVSFDGGIVVKQCGSLEDMRIEAAIAQHAEQILGDDRVPDTEFSEEEEALRVQRYKEGVAYGARGGKRVFWNQPDGTDSPKLGRVQNFSAEAKARLRADVERLHANGVAHNDIHAGNIAIKNIENGVVTDAVLIDYSNAIDVSMLTELPDTFRAINRSIARGVDYGPYVAKVMENGYKTAEELFGEAKAYDKHMLDVLGL